ncbi:MAG: glycosyltransferase family 9 protein [Chloroflexota bacterium]|nr:MAG: glycosyltransferase family 9 protein [Chloroflexota bacterium]
MTARTAIRLTLLRLFARLYRGPHRPPMGSPRRVLLLRPDHIGDLLFCTPALRLFRQSWSETHLTLAVGPWARAVLQNNPCLDEILTLDFPGFSRRPKGSLLAPYALLRREARRIRQLQFDLVVTLRFDFWWGALLAYMAGVPWRLGYDVPEVRPFLTASLDYQPGLHEVEQNLRLARFALGSTPSSEPIGLEFYPTDEDTRSASAWLSASFRKCSIQSDKTAAVSETAAVSGIDPVAGSPIICLHPGAGWPVKHWRPEGFALVADALARAHGARIVIIGGPGEEQLVDAVAHAMRGSSIQATGLSLGQVAAILARSILAVGTDSGIMHLATAVGTPTVHLYGPVDQRLFGPWGEPQLHRVVTAGLDCAPCNRLDFPIAELDSHRCVRDIQPTSVLRAAEEVLRQTVREGR